MADEKAISRATFGLDEVLGALGADLWEARSNALDHGFGLAVTSAEVELSFTVEHSLEGKGGVNLRVFGVGAGGDIAKTNTEESVHRIKLTLQPTGNASDALGVAVAGDLPPGSTKTRS